MDKITLPEKFRKHTLPSATQGVEDSRRYRETAQTRSPAYRLSFADPEFLVRDEMRMVRLQLEWQKPELLQQELGVHSTIVVFGSARLEDRETAEANLDRARRDLEADGSESSRREVARAERMLGNAHYYEEARRLGRMVSSTCQVGGSCEFVVTTGGGPGIMEAANRGAADVGAKSIGLNIVLPHEQAPNPFITPELCFQFHYFAIRKMHFLMRAKALICFPGGFGTLDELFEALTLIQTHKIDPIPVLLFGRSFWDRLIDWDYLVEQGTISASDLDLMHYVETAEEAWDFLCRFHEIRVQAREARDE